MKSYRRVLAALVLALVCAPATFADDGIIQCGAPAPQPVPTVAGIIWPEGIMWPDAPVELTELSFDLVSSLLTRR